MSERLDPGRTALLFFDMLNGHVRKDDAATKSRYAPVIAAAVRLLEAARRSGVVVMYAAAHHRPDNASSAHLLTDTDNRLRPIPAGAPPSFLTIVESRRPGSLARTSPTCSRTSPRTTPASRLRRAWAGSRSLRPSTTLSRP